MIGTKPCLDTVNPLFADAVSSKGVLVDPSPAQDAAVLQISYEPVNVY